MKSNVTAGRRSKRQSYYSVNPHARRMKEDAEEATRVQEVARKRDKARRWGNEMERLCKLTRAELDATNQQLVKAQGEIQDNEIIIRHFPDTAERLTVAAMRFFGRLRWALGVAFTGRFLWQRRNERTER